MATIELMPVDPNSLSAVLNLQTKKLYLSAKGAVAAKVENIHFVPLVRGPDLRFELVGTRDFNTHNQIQPFEVNREPFPCSVVPFPKVVIFVVRGNNGEPQHVIKPIQVLWGPSPSPGHRNDPSSEVPSGQADNLVVQQQHPSLTPPTIIVLEGEGFNIKQNANSSNHGTISIDFDKQYLELGTARIANEDIVWTFLAKKLGCTALRVIVIGGLDPIV